MTGLSTSATSVNICVTMLGTAACVSAGALDEVVFAALVPVSSCDPELGDSRPSCSRIPLPLATSSNPGGGSKSILELDAANAMASAPYGLPNRAKLSRLDMSRTWSGVGPFFG